MLDLTNAIEEINYYKGSEKKKTLVYEGKKYLVKFPDPIREKGKNISYINNAFSEYVGSNIFRLCGFNVQNTMLAIYKYNEREKIVCACEDFTDRNHILYEFENLALSTNPDKKIETELDDIMDVIDENKMINSDETKKKFWDMFIIDALIGNTDRHNGNWGFLYNSQVQKAEIAPVFDCGSCLLPQADKHIMSLILNNNDEMNARIYNFPTSAIKDNGRKINYYDFLMKAEHEECREAVLRIAPKINIRKISELIYSIPYLTDLQKDFYTSYIEARNEKIITPSLEHIISLNVNQINEYYDMEESDQGLTMKY